MQVSISANSRFLLPLLCLFLGGISANAQNSGFNINDETLEPLLAKSLQFIEGNQNDSALFYLQPVFNQLDQNSLSDSPFGLEVQLAIGKALEQDNQDIQAVKLLNALKENAKNKEQWKTYAGACLALAQLHLKIWRGNPSRQHLKLAGQAIALRGLNEFESEYLMLMAYWHQIFGHPDSVSVYARQALDILSPKDTKKPYLQLAFHMLIGHLNGHEDDRAIIEHFQTAATIARKLKDYDQLSYLYHKIAERYGYLGRQLEALAYNDSTIHACYQAIAAGQTRIPALADAYMARGAIFKNLGQLDSALLYSSRGSAQKLQLVIDEERFRVIELDAKYNDEKKSLLLVEQQKQIRTGRQFRLLLVAVILLVLLILVLVIRNFFKQRQTNQKLAEQAEQLTALDKMKSQFFANVSHELRTPLTLLLGPINSLLKNNQLSPQEMKFLQLAHKNGRQLEQLINEILDLRKLEAGKLELELEATELRTFLLPFLAQFESLAHHKSMDFSFQFEVDPTIAVMIDREKYRQILYNLLSNAFKHTPQEGKILTRITIGEERLKLEVKDNGPGIHPDDMPHLFDRYFQTNRPERPIEGGTGIGLALCREYAQLMQGDIQVESTPGAGALFTVTIPITIVDTPVATKKAPVLDRELEKTETKARPTESRILSQPLAPNTQHNPKPHILVVEDNLDLQDYIRLVLSEKYQITTAMNGAEALKVMAKANPFQLLISDLMMPVMDGYQFLEKIKSYDATRHIPFIMLTARAAVQDKLKALRIGVDDYMIKPFDEEELVARIENLLRHQAARKEARPTDDQSPKTPIIISKADQKWLENFEAYVRENIVNDLLSASMLADEFAMSDSTLLRQLKRLTGLSPGQYLLEIRLNEAKRLLENGAYRSVAQVAETVGYRESRSFWRSFRKRFGKSPSEFQITGN